MHHVRRGALGVATDKRRRANHSHLATFFRLLYWFLHFLRGDINVARLRVADVVQRLEHSIESEKSRAGGGSKKTRSSAANK